jgi:uncharacterized protein YodC (DUF2158 family)
MAIIVTSYTPTTGPETGGTLVTFTGTGMGTVDAVLFDGAEAEIVGAPTATAVVVRTPPGATGTADVTVADTAANNFVQAGVDFTYTAVSAAEQLVTTLANKFRLDVRNVGDANFTKVRGITTIKPGLQYTTEDDSDIDSGIDGADLVTGRKADVTGTVKRGKGVTSNAYDPGQEIIRTAAENAGTVAGTIECRWFDRTGGPEAYTAFALAQWSPQGGNKTADKVDFTLNIQGRRTVIANPVIADSSLAL